jgi:hypothetical protein
MPSVQQVRWEAFADAVDRATRAPLLQVFAPNARENVEARLDLAEGVSLECRLLQIDLDRGELVGKTRTGASLNIPLTRVRAVWHKRRRRGRALSIWFATLLLSGAAGGMLGAPMSGWGKFQSGAVLGALLGAIAGVGVVFLIDGWRALHEWIPMYDSTPPS